MVWYYVKDGARQGPVEEAEMNRLVAESVVRPDTLVWSEGMPDWRPYSTIAPPAPPPPQPVEPAVQPAAYGSSEPRSGYGAEPAAQAAVATGPAAAAAQPLMYCTQCGRQYPGEELVRFGTAQVCANCKDIYAQRLRETGHVAGARVYGGFWIRFVAVLIDGFILWVVNFAIQLATGATAMFSNPSQLAMAMGFIGLYVLLSTAIGLCYEAFFLVKYGATPGKMALKLKVITPDGGGISWGRAIGRHFAKILSSITLLIGFIMAAFDNEKRALHDYIAGTRVIKVG